jgi:hypothetical protein
LPLFHESSVEELWSAEDESPAGEELSLEEELWLLGS